VRGRGVEPVIRAFAHHDRKVELGFRRLQEGDLQQPPLYCQQVEVTRDVFTSDNVEVSLDQAYEEDA
jgi:hypothetical protein